MITDTLTAAGRLEVQVLDTDTGALVSQWTQPNLVVTAGRNLIRDAFAGVVIAPPNRLALGTDNTAPTAGDITLGSEVWRDAFTTTTQSTGQVLIKYFLTSTMANGNTIREAGLFNAPAGGTLYARTVLTQEIVKTSAIAVLFVWTLTWSAV